MDHNLRNHRRSRPFELALAGALLLMLYALCQLPSARPAAPAPSWVLCKGIEGAAIPCPETRR